MIFRHPEYASSHMSCHIGGSRSLVPGKICLLQTDSRHCWSNLINSSFSNFLLGAFLASQWKTEFYRTRQMTAFECEFAHCKKSLYRTVVVVSKATSLTWTHNGYSIKIGIVYEIQTNCGVDLELTLFLCKWIYSYDVMKEEPSASINRSYTFFCPKTWFDHRIDWKMINWLEFDI